MPERARTRYRLGVIRPFPSFLRRGLLLAALALAASPAGCSKPDPQPAPVPLIDLSPVPAPAGLVAELFLPTPDATWAKARIAVGGPALFLPVNAGTLVANLLGMPVTAAQEIDGNVPVLGAVVDTGEGAPPDASAEGAGAARQRARAAIGIHVKDGDRLVNLLTRGEGARFDWRMDATTSITLIEPKGTVPPGVATNGSVGAEAPSSAPAPPARGRAVMGVLGNYLLIGSVLEDLTTVGPYVARTMPKAPVPKEDLAVEIPRAAIDGPILGAALGFWGKVRELAIAPTVESWFAILGDVERARVTVVLDEAAHVRFTATPRAGSGAASKAVSEAAVGDVKPLLELPGDALAGLLVRERPEARGEGVGQQVQGLVRLLGQEVPEKEREQITAALRAVAEARGDWFSAGLRWAGTGPTAYARSAVSDEEKLGKAIQDLVELAKVPSVKAFLKQEGLRVSSAKHVVERLPGDARRVRFERAEEKEKKGAEAPAGDPAETLPRAIDLVYLLEKGSLFAAAGYEPDEAIRRMVGAPEGERLGATPAFQAALGKLGEDTSFALVLDPLRIVAMRSGKPPQGDPTPVVLAAGASKGGAEASGLWVRVDVPTAVIREVVRYRGAL